MTCALVDWLSVKTAMPKQTIEYLVQTGPHRYKAFYVPKRSGRGVRLIAQPAKELKELQRLAVTEFLEYLPVHSAVHGYVKGRGIRSNAAVHAKSSYLLKLDLRDFFPSLVPKDLIAHIEKYGKTSDNVHAKTLRGLFFWQPKGTATLHMCIGAPSSPFLSNTLLYDFDCAIADFCVGKRISYTRYSDDLTFSTYSPGLLAEVELFAAQLIEGLKYPKIALNTQKTIHTSRKHRRIVTGITLSSDLKLSIGRDRKRLIRSMAFRASLNELSAKELEEFRGLLNFARDIEPEFVRRLMNVPRKIP